MSCKLKISKGSGKMALIGSINTNPLDNDFCERMSKSNAVCSVCYSRKSLGTYRKNCGTVWSKNGEILSSRALSTDEIPKINAAVFRFQSHGELMNRQHAENLLAIAQANPDTRFGFWTKRPEFVDGLDIPDNVIMIYSNPLVDKVMVEPPPGFDKVFNVVSNEEHYQVNCGARDCFGCQRCYKKTTTSVIVEHIK